MSRLKIKDDSYYPEELFKDMVSSGNYNNSAWNLPSNNINNELDKNIKAEEK